MSTMMKRFVFVCLLFFVVLPSAVEVSGFLAAASRGKFRQQSSPPACKKTTSCPEVSFTCRPDGYTKAIVACGWFWHPQPEFQNLRGVVNCVVGYSGGVSPDPTYDNMQDYTEALLVDFDPQMISYADILTVWRQLHTPYPNKRQYRSAIMYLSEEQRKIAESMFGNEKYVDIEPATKFYLAEEYHQNYLQKMKQMFR